MILHGWLLATCAWGAMRQEWRFCRPRRLFWEFLHVQNPLSHKLLAAALLVWAGSGLWQAGKPLPEGISAEFPWRPAAKVSFLADCTFVDGQGRRRSEQVIFDEILAMIGGAQRLVVADMFLCNDFEIGRASCRGR